MTGSNVDVVTEIYRAISQEEMAEFAGMLADDVEWIEAAGWPHGGTYEGPTAVVDLFEAIGAEWEEFSAVADRHVDAGDTVVSLGTCFAKHADTGDVVETPYVHVWDFEDGLVVRFQQVSDTALVQEAL